MAIEISDELQEDRVELDPFDDAVGRGGPFTNPDRTLALNKLIHLAPYSELLLLTGPHGVGRTTLAEQFIGRAVDTWRAALVQVRESDLDTDLLLKIIDRLEMPLVTSDESRGILLDALARFLESLGRSGRRAIIVLDDAHNLSDEQLAMLGGLLEDYRSRNALSLVLVGPTGFEARLAEIPALAERLTHTLALPPLDCSDTGIYIRHRLETAGQSEKATLFTPEVVEEIHHQSGGLPLAINALARTVLRNRRIDKVRRPAEGGGRGRYLLMGVAALVVVVVVAMQERINAFFEPAPESEVVESKPLPIVEAPPPAPEQMAEAVVPEAEEVVPLPVPAPAASEPEALPTPAPEALAAAIGPPPQEQPAPAEPEPSPMEEKAQATPPPAPEPDPGLRWLMAQPPGNFTLQLMALADEAKVRRFVTRHAIEGESAIFPIERKGKRLFVLVYGSFPDRESASAAKQPARWGVSNPWPRTFESVRRELEGS